MNGCMHPSTNIHETESTKKRNQKRLKKKNHKTSFNRPFTKHL